MAPGATAALSGGLREALASDHGSAGDMTHFFDDFPSATTLITSTSMATLKLAAAKK